MTAPDDPRDDAIAIIGKYVHLTEGMRAWWGKCPFHQEKGSSFTVNVATHRFYCFGCGRGGSAADFLDYMREQGKL